MNIFNRFYLKLSLSLLLVLLIVGFAYVTVTINASCQFFEKKNQLLNGDIAAHLVEEINPIVNGELDSTSIGRIMHSMMAVNPSIEVYLLDTEGLIIAHVAPYKKVKRKSVGLAPIKSFIASRGEEFVKGDDPRDFDKQKVFSAAAIKENGDLKGYAYIILASQEAETVGASLWSDFISSVGTKNMLLALGAALVLGMICFYLITRYLRVIIETVKRFKEGELHARIPVRSGGDFNVLAENFNGMRIQ